MSFKKWEQYFEDNVRHFEWLDMVGASKLSGEEVDTIAASVQQFQKGENSEGKQLIEFAQSMGDENYFEAIKSFIREEQRHAAALGKFMAHNDIQPIREHWIDSVFRSLRKCAGLENSVMVLLTAEIIAAVYYKALRDSTSSPELANICRRILIDEEMHINFQSFALYTLYQKKNILSKIFTRIAHRTLMSGTIVVVWASHSKVLRAGGFTFASFFRDVFAEFSRSESMILGNQEAVIRLTPVA